MPGKEILGVIGVYVFCWFSLSLENFDKIAKHKETNVRKNSRNSRFRRPNIFRLYITLSSEK